MAWYRLLSQARRFYWTVAGAIPTARRVDHSIDEIALGCMSDGNVCQILKALDVDVGVLKGELTEHVRLMANDPQRNEPRTTSGKHQLGPGQRAMAEAATAAIGARWYWPTIDTRRVFAACLSTKEESFVRRLLAQRGVSRRRVLLHLAAHGASQQEELPVGDVLEVAVLNNDVASFAEATDFLSAATGTSPERATELAVDVHRRGAATVYRGPRTEAIAAHQRAQQLLVDQDVPIVVILRAPSSSSESG